MKIERKTSNTPLVIAIAAGAVIAAVVAYILVAQPFSQNNNAKDQSAPPNTVDYSPPSQDEIDAGNEAKKQTAEQQDEPQTTPPTSENLVVTISRASQMGAGGSVAVRTFIDGATTGTCDVIFTREGVTFTKTFNITADASSHTCNGDISAAEFNAAGEWNMSIVAKSEGITSAQAATQKVTIQK